MKTNAFQPKALVASLQSIWRNTDKEGLPVTQQAAFKYDPAFAIATPVRLWSGSLWQALPVASGTDVYSSPDGKVWTLRTLPYSQIWRGIAHNGAGTFIAVGGTNTTQTAISTNGTTWTAGAATTSPADWGQIAYGAGTFVMVTNGTSTSTQYSTNNGTTWNLGSIGATVSKIVFLNDRFIAGSFRYSTDGINWDGLTGVGTVTNFSFGNGIYLGATTSSSNTVYYSKNGVNFTAAILPVTDTWSDIGFDAPSGLFVLVASSATGVILTSPDCITWTQRKNYDLTAGAAAAIQGPTGLAVQQGGVLRFPDRNAVEVTYLLP